MDAGLEWIFEQSQPALLLSMYEIVAGIDLYVAKQLSHRIVEARSLDEALNC